MIGANIWLLLDVKYTYLYNLRKNLVSDSSNTAQETAANALHFEKKCSIRLAFRRNIETRKKTSVCHAPIIRFRISMKLGRLIGSLWKTLTLEARLRSETRSFKFFGKN